MLIKKSTGGYSVARLGSMLTWQTCIPYNSETEYLLGTDEDCPEHYKWWDDE